MKIDRKNDLNLRMLEVFGSAMRNLTTVAAAEELGISQPAVSNALKALEKKLGFVLFNRTSKGLIPTDEAHIVYDESEPLFIMMRGLEGQIQSLRSTRKGRLRICATPPLSQTVIPQALKSFLADRKDVQVSYDIRGIDAVIRSIENGSADLGLLLGVEGHAGYEAIPLHEGSMECVMLPDHPLAALNTVSPADIAQHDFIGIGIDHESRLGVLVRSAFALEGVFHKTNLTVRYCHTACVLTSAGLGVSIVDPFTSRFLQFDDLISKPFTPDIRISAVAIVREGKPMSKVCAAFIDELKTVLKSQY